MAVRPVDPPPCNFEKIRQALEERVRKGFGHVILPDGTRLEVEMDADPYLAFQKGQLDAYQRWLNGIVEFDGSGLVDAVKTNAQDLNTVKQANTAAHQEFGADILKLEQELAALRSQIEEHPFPA